MSKKTWLIFGLAIKVHYLLNVYFVFNPNKLRIHIYVVDHIRYNCTLIRFDQAPIATKKV